MKQITVFSHSSLRWLSCGSSILVVLEFGNLEMGFVEGAKPENPEKKPSEQGEYQHQTQTTYGTEPESNPGHIGGRRAFIPALQRQSNRSLNMYWMETSCQLTVCIVQFTHITLSWCWVIVNSGAVKLVKEKKTFSMRCTESHYEVRRRTPTPHGP